MAMSRRHAKPRLSPIWMPYLRDKLADHLDHPPLPFHHVTDYQRELAGAWSNGDGLRHSPMWWVSRDMTSDVAAVNTGIAATATGRDITGPPQAHKIQSAGQLKSVECTYSQLRWYNRKHTGKVQTMGLAELRKSKNLTQRGLAARSGISNVTIANYERGERDIGNMTLRNAIRIADALKVRDLRKLLDD